MRMNILTRFDSFTSRDYVQCFKSQSMAAAEVVSVSAWLVLVSWEIMNLASTKNRLCDFTHDVPMMEDHSDFWAKITACEFISAISQGRSDEPETRSCSKPCSLSWIYSRIAYVSWDVLKGDKDMH